MATHDIHAPQDFPSAHRDEPVPWSKALGRAESSKRAADGGVYVTESPPGMPENHDSKAGRAYPFRNYWTATGGVGEVLLALPTKADADAMVELYMDNVDPLYPIIPRNFFQMHYEDFWRLPHEERHEFTPLHIALQFIVFATGRLYMEDEQLAERLAPSETYLSCCYRVLCLSSFLSKWSLDTIQILILICNYFITNNRTADSWTFSGILQKQAYGMDLHRTPDIKMTVSEKQLRCRLWQAAMFQDVSMSYYLELIPATTQHSIDVTCLSRVDQGENNPEQRMQEMLSHSSKTDLSFLTCPSDVDYVRAIWRYAEFMQANICQPLAFGRAMVKDAAHKIALMSELQHIYESLEWPLNTTDFRDKELRIKRQMIMVSSNYHFALTMLYLAQNLSGGAILDAHGALKSSNKAMDAYFTLVTLSRQHVNMWTAANVRAYAQTIMIGQAISKLRDGCDRWNEDPWLHLALGDFDRYVDMLTHAHGTGAFEIMKQERVAILSDMRKSIMVS